MVFPNRFDIREISTSGHNYNTLIQNARSAVAIALDVKNNMIYWADNVNKTISRAHRSSNSDASVEIIVSTGLHKPEGLAVDWVGKKLYWADSRKFLLCNVIRIFNVPNKSKNAYTEEFSSIDVSFEFLYSKQALS